MEKFQRKIREWMLACFGSAISMDRRERNHRFFEEAIELVQAGGMSKEDALMLIDYTYARPIGEKVQEVGGVMVTLAAWCDAHGINLKEAAWMEQERIWGKIDAIREKQRTKPKNSPLPQHTSGSGDYSFKINPQGHIEGLALNEGSFKVVGQNQHPDIHIGPHLKLTKEGFYFSDERITDGGKAYNLFVQALNGQAPLQNQHPDDVAIDLFAQAMKERMAQKRKEGRGGWEDKDQCSAYALQQALRYSTEVGITTDVANYAMMLFNRGETTAMPNVHIPRFDQVGKPCRNEILIRGVGAVPKSCPRCGLGHCAKGIEYPGGQ